MRKKKPELSLWVAVWRGVAFEGRSRTRRLRYFTVAASKKEATAVMADGLMGWRGTQGSNCSPESVKRLDVPREKLPEIVVQLMDNGARFIMPYERIRPMEVSTIALLLMLDPREEEV